MDFQRVMAELAEEGRRREEIARQEIPRITAELIGMGATKVILFGSRARGEHTDWSDIDMIAVMRSDLPFPERLMSVYRQVLPRVALDLLVYTPEEFERGNPLISTALEHGQVLYEAS